MPINIEKLEHIRLLTGFLGNHVPQAALEFIGSNPDCTLKDIYSNITATNVSVYAAVDKLEGFGLVTSLGVMRKKRIRLNDIGIANINLMLDVATIITQTNIKVKEDGSSMH